MQRSPDSTSPMPGRAIQPAPLLLSGLAALALALCAACSPIFPATECASKLDCPKGYLCDKDVDFCVPEPDAGGDASHVDAVSDALVVDVVLSDATLADASAPDQLALDRGNEDASISQDASQRDARGADGSGPRDGGAGNDAGGQRDGGPGNDASGPADGGPSSDGADADSALPDSAAPDSAEPDSAAPDSAGPDGALPDSAAPDSAEPDSALPDSAQADSARPDTGIFCQYLGNDEDGDGVTDNCDNCPTVPNPSQDDVEEEANGQAADGVGDACDPRPTHGGDSILFYDNFANDLHASWEPEETGWSTAAGQLLYAGSQTSAFIHRSGIQLGDFLLNTRATLINENGFNAHAVSAAVNNTVSQYPGCNLDDTRNKDYIELLTVDDNGWNPLSRDQVQIDDLVTGTAYEISMNGFGSTISCTTTAPPPEVATDTFTTITTRDTIALRAWQGHFAFDWIIVYDLAGPI